MINCGKITKSLTTASCNEGQVGLSPEVILLNIDDIKEMEEAAGVISEITMNTGKYGYKYDGARDSYEASVALVAGTYINRFAHTLVMRILTRTQDIKTETNKLAQARVVAIVKHIGGADAVKYEVFGAHNGLVMTDLQISSADADNVYMTVTLATSERGAEAELPASFFDTDLDTTEAALAALLQTT